MKLPKYLYRIILTFFILGLFTFIFGFIWVKKYSWRDIATEQKMKLNGKQIMNSTKLSDNFYQVYDVTRPKDRKTSMTEQVWSRFIGSRNRSDCKCDDIGYISWNNDNLNLNVNLSKLLKPGGYLKFGFGLENYVSPEKCFDYWINNDIFLNGEYLIDLNTLSIIVMKKEINLLDTDEILLLMAWHDMLQIGRSDHDIINERFQVLKRMYESAKPVPNKV